MYLSLKSLFILAADNILELLFFFLYRPLNAVESFFRFNGSHHPNCQQRIVWEKEFIDSDRMLDTLQAVWKVYLFFLINSFAKRPTHCPSLLQPTTLHFPEKCGLNAE